MKFPYKVYAESDVGKKVMIAAVRYPHDAGRIVIDRPEMTVKADGRVVWNEEKDLALLQPGNRTSAASRSAIMLNRRGANFRDSERRFKAACAKADAKRKAQ